MALENVEKFEELLRSDEATKAKMDELFKAWEGDKTDDKAAFEAVVAPIAAEAGLPFTYEEANECAGGAQLDDAQLEAVVGGDMIVCFLIGAGNKIGAKCWGEHGVACAYIGVTGGAA